MESKTIKKLSEFGEGFKHHHENYEASSISKIRETGGVWAFDLPGAQKLDFHFPEHFGFCYGVDKAIDLVFETCERFPNQRIFLTDQLIHNPYINKKLHERGVQHLERDKDHLLICDGLKPEDRVVVSAFGTDFRDIENLKEKGVTIVDSTCGAIINVWKRVERYAKNGFITVMHGKRNHEETRATLSQAIKEGGSTIAIENIAEAKDLAQVILGKIPESDFMQKYPEAIPKSFTFDSATCKMGMANQTTMLKGESLQIQELLRNAFRERFGDSEVGARFRSFDTICGATQDRQDALRKMLQEKLDLVLIVGGFNSSNTSHLAEITDQKLPYYHIEGVDDILSSTQVRYRDPISGKVLITERSFLRDVHHIGITSGASTPDVTLFKIIQKICSLKIVVK